MIYGFDEPLNSESNISYLLSTERQCCRYEREGIPNAAEGNERGKSPYDIKYPVAFPHSPDSLSPNKTGSSRVSL